MEKLKNILYNVWSLQSSSKWTKDNPAKGQCGVTALVVHDLFGGKIVKTRAEEGWHFYNVINEQRHDFTESQFPESIQYMDVLSSREEAMLDTNEKQYSYLKQNVKKQWR
ncbi:YunG family protein [Fictibacillus nanhaiensis]|uniref:YunG family protein n=1 Tax=Fictibacillus nanhaiensis TaxID=742169 RepID=UPI003CC7E833